MAKNEFKFLNSRQLQTKARHKNGCNLKHRTRRLYIKYVTASSRSNSLCSYLDELLEELDSLTELPAEADLGDHPQLNLVEPAQEQVQIGRGSPEVLPAERVVQQLVLGRGGWRHLGGKQL